ncbi:unnamed protein product, partial [Mesorhabditis belari]|uniref:Uncharacterized protein n=1 Tax=Mesorhabditis belari TaxID=2138241 RepID=A0AAF3FDX8_9BILA
MLWKVIVILVVQVAADRHQASAPRTEPHLWGSENPNCQSGGLNTDDYHCVFPWIFRALIFISVGFLLLFAFCCLLCNCCWQEARNKTLRDDFERFTHLSKQEFEALQAAKMLMKDKGYENPNYEIA